MKFIFPSNYAFRNKLFGIIDYTTAIVNLIWYIFIFCLVNLIFQNTSIKVFIFISLCFTVFLFSILGFKNENIINILSYIIKFYKNRNIYFYKKY